MEGRKEMGERIEGRENGRKSKRKIEKMFGSRKSNLLFLNVQRFEEVKDRVDDCE